MGRISCDGGAGAVRVAPGADGRPDGEGEVLRYRHHLSGETASGWPVYVHLPRVRAPPHVPARKQVRARLTEDDPGDR